MEGNNINIVSNQTMLVYDWPKHAGKLLRHSILRDSLSYLFTRVAFAVDEEQGAKNHSWH